MCHSASAKDNQTPFIVYVVGPLKTTFVVLYGFYYAYGVGDDILSQISKFLSNFEVFGRTGRTFGQ
jgi:hypothetical protein